MKEKIIKNIKVKLKKIKKIALIVLGAFVFIAFLAYIDFFNTRANSTTPKMSIKREIDENTVVYKAIFYIEKF